MTIVQEGTAAVSSCMVVGMGMVIVIVIKMVMVISWW